MRVALLIHLYGFGCFLLEFDELVLPPGYFRENLSAVLV
jgi:hypothetical protein